jgi:hypothetical protein
MRRKRDQDFYAKRGAHEGASRGEIAYTTDNERELAWRRRKEKGERLLSDGEGEEKKLIFRTQFRKTVINAKD